MPSAESDALRAHYQSMSDRLIANPSMDLTSMRNMLEELHLRAAEPVGVTYGDVEAGGVPALLCTPQEADPDRIILYLHGGGFVVNSIHSHRKLAAHLAKAVGCAALVLDYRLAPEHPFPAQLDDATAAYRWLLDEKGTADHIAVVGDSAGGNLATALTLKLRDEDLAVPAAIVGFSPWYDMECQEGTLETNATTDAFVQRPVIENMAQMYLGETAPTHPLANPLHADPSGLPPMYLAAGGHETLQDNSERFAELARNKGVDVTLEITPQMQHVYVFMAGRAPEADATIAKVAQWLRLRLGIS